MRLTVALVLSCVLLLLPVRELAAGSCGGVSDSCQCNANNPYPCCNNGNGKSSNCTWGAWHQACCNWGMGLPSPWQHAKYWAGNYATHPQLEVNSTPSTGSIGCKADGYYGHVAWVTGVSGGTVSVYEQSCCEGSTCWPNCSWCYHGFENNSYSSGYFTGGYIKKKGPVNKCGDGSCNNGETASSCPQDCKQCNPGEQQSQGCGNCGNKKRTCQGNYQWGGWSGCDGQGACSAGKKESKGCGLCGKKQRKCKDNCSWGDWGGCKDEGNCTPGDKKSEDCGNCGYHEKKCKDNCHWPDWSNCKDQGPCSPGSHEVGGCGNCGARERDCKGDCHWTGWTPCQGEGVCPAGQVKSESCGDCGSRERKCKDSCSWTGWSDCAGPHPGDGKLPCDSGLAGICKDGLQRCLAGWLTCQPIHEPQPELCDGQDNDCNGTADDGFPAQFGEPAPALAARLVDVSHPLMLAPGQRTCVWADFENVGTATWQAGSIWLRCKSPGGLASTLAPPGGWPAWDTAAVLEREVKPGEMARFEFSLAAPDAPGVKVGESFQLFSSIGKPVMCPAPEFRVELAVSGLFGSDVVVHRDDLNSGAEISRGDAGIERSGGGGCAAGRTHASNDAGAILLAVVLVFMVAGQGHRSRNIGESTEPTCSHQTG